MRKRTILRLVNGTREEPSSTGPVLQSLRSALRGPELLLPDDVAILRQVTGEMGCTRHAIDALVASGEIRRVIVGREPHLALPRVDLRATESDDLESAHGDEAFRLSVLIDAETEHIVMYRVAMVVQGVITLVLARSWLLYWFLP